MGMAASQARFLQLTARRSNNEYMGQQINQARTALANKSAGLFEQMLSLKPPSPPSSLDDKYYTQGYTFIDETDDLRKKIVWQQFEDIAEAEFNVSGVFDYSYWDNAGPPNAEVTVNNQAVSMNGSEYLEAIGLEDDDVQAALNADMLATRDMTELEVDAYMQSGGSSLHALMGGLPTDFKLPSDASVAVVRYVTLEHTAYDPEGNYKVVQEKMPGLLIFDNRERLIGFNELDVSAGLSAAGFDADYYNPGASGTPAQNYSGDGVTPVGNAGDPPADIETAMTFSSNYVVNSSRVEKGDELSYNGQFDDAAFNDDMNRYEFDKSAYDYQVERINLETAQLQQQDKSLELKLKQIDTDHKAIQTEMEAVQKVIQKNIETTFKTFA